MKTWDAFISHASEDNESVVLPLVNVLRKSGLTIWLDKTELRIGDSLLEKIDEGLARSRFGIVILSRSFLSKGWTRKELNGLMAIEDRGQKVILPVWHGIDKSLLTQYSPILADRLAANTGDGIASVAAALTSVILEPGSGSPSDLVPGLALRLSRLLEQNPDKAAITSFLSAHRGIIEKACGTDPNALFVWCRNCRLPAGVEALIPDLCLGKLWPTMGRRIWEVLVFEQASQSLFRDTGEPSSFLVQAVQRLSDFRNWVGIHLAEARTSLPDFAPTFFGIVVASRRPRDPEVVQQLAAFNDSLIGLRVRTYDWLIEAASTLQV